MHERAETGRETPRSASESASSPTPSVASDDPGPEPSPGAGPRRDAAAQRLDARLIAAARRRDVEQARALVRRGADVNTKDARQESAFLLATSEGPLAMLELALRNGARVNAKDSFNGTGMIRAADRGHADIVGRLGRGHRPRPRQRPRLDRAPRGGDPRRRQQQVRRHRARPGRVRRVVRTGIDVDHVNDLGWTALLEAVILGDGGPRHQRVVRILLEAGADPTIADRDGVTALEHARSRGHEAIAVMLRRAS